VRLIPTAGQRGDCPQAAALIEGLEGVGHVIADAACDAGNLRAVIEDAAHEAHPYVPDVTNAELVLLRVRVIALESLLIAVLAEGSDQQRQLARDMADVITPRDGFTQHSLTIRAAQHINDLVDRADHVRSTQP
jgi:transposase